MPSPTVRGDVGIIRRRRVDGSGSEETLPAITPPALTFPRQWSRTEVILSPKIRTPGLFRIGKSPDTAAELVAGAESYINGASVSERAVAGGHVHGGESARGVRPTAARGRSKKARLAGRRRPAALEAGCNGSWTTRRSTARSWPSTFRGDTFAASRERLFTTRPARDELRQVYSTVDGQRFLVRTPHAAAAPSIVWLDGWRTRFEKSREP